MRDALQDVYVEQLQDLYNAEQQILKALPKMAKNARHSELQTALKDHEVAKARPTRSSDISPRR